MVDVDTGPSDLIGVGKVYAGRYIALAAALITYLEKLFGAR